MPSTAFILLALGIVANVHLLYGASLKKYKAIYECPVPEGVCYFEPEDTCESDNDCNFGPGYGCCPHICGNNKRVCELLNLTNPTEVPTTTRVQTTTEVPTTTHEPTTTEAPTTLTEVPTTTNVPTTRAVPTTTDVPPTATEVSPTTTEVPPTTTKVPSTTTEVPTTQTPTTTQPPDTTTSARPTTKQAPTTTATKPPTSVCGLSKPKDILFLVDGSVKYQEHWMERKKHFRQIKNFIKQVVLELKNDKFKIGLMQFGGKREPTMDINFSDSADKDEFSYYVDSLWQRHGWQRYTGKALAAASQKLYEMNTIYDRHDTQDIIVLITHGRPWDKKTTKSELEVLRSIPVRIITVGIGSNPDYMKKGLKDISSTPGDLYATKYRHLQNIGNDVLKGICSTVVVAAIVSPCKNKQYDLFFLVDGSASISHRHFEKKRKFLDDLFVYLKSQQSDINTGLMQFSEIEKTELMLELDRHTLRTELDVIQTVSYQSGQKTMLGNALERVNNEVLTGEGGDRRDVKNVLIVLSDGRAHDRKQAFEQARSIKDKGTHVITITTSPRAFVHDLRRIASGRKNALRIDLDDAANCAKKLSLMLCKLSK